MSSYRCSLEHAGCTHIDTVFPLGTLMVNLNSTLVAARHVEEHESISRTSILCTV